MGAGIIVAERDTLVRARRRQIQTTPEVGSLEVCKKAQQTYLVHFKEVQRMADTQLTNLRAQLEALDGSPPVEWTQEMREDAQRSVP